MALTADTFPAAVTQFSEAHARLAEAAAALREHRKRTKALGDDILAYMQAHGIDECDAPAVRLVRKQTTRTEALKREHIQGELQRVLPDGAEQAVTNMYNRRLTDTQETLAVLKRGDDGPERA